jgi:hypothetical protein
MCCGAGRAGDEAVCALVRVTLSTPFDAINHTYACATILLHGRTIPQRLYRALRCLLLGPVGLLRLIVRPLTSSSSRTHVTPAPLPPLNRHSLPNSAHQGGSYFTHGSPFTVFAHGATRCSRNKTLQRHQPPTRTRARTHTHTYTYAHTGYDE